MGRHTVDSLPVVYISMWPMLMITSTEIEIENASLFDAAHASIFNPLFILF